MHAEREAFLHGIAMRRRTDIEERHTSERTNFIEFTNDLVVIAANAIKQFSIRLRCIEAIYAFDVGLEPRHSFSTLPTRDES
ncbi:hypothetical protein RHOFW104T7_08430 [Rhodanobacter thiooxydans]|uniref:Uncharacterized protein n=1 Tax=Rhodanobacter thiooxydans TaxID=416169 RepID=A0A154QJM7_9GAMM|nr:hypothetical protein RHOFW104T7_08430 [Rhodanobacter thiooxydans]